MSRVLPILFNTDMVRAILDGRKTVTRRAVKKYNIRSDQEISKNLKGQFELYNVTPRCGIPQGTIFKPPYQMGDILYVRETWCWCPCWDCGMDTEEHNCCDKTAAKFFNHSKREWGCYCYKASCEDNEYPSVDTWHPSIHMPKKAARIWLKVTDVRVERLDDMKVEDAVHEGINMDGLVTNRGIIEYRVWNRWNELWDSTIPKKDLLVYGSEANPWVWVIEFERCEKPTPCILKGIEPAEYKHPCIGYGESETEDEPCEMCKGCNFLYWLPKIKSIGNIFDNPELLKV